MCEEKKEEAWFHFRIKNQDQGFFFFKWSLYCACRLGLEKSINNIFLKGFSLWFDPQTTSCRRCYGRRHGKRSIETWMYVLTWKRVLGKGDAVELGNKELFGRLKLFLNAKSSLSLWSKWQIGHMKWFLNTNLFLIKPFLIAKFDSIAIEWHKKFSSQ